MSQPYVALRGGTKAKTVVRHLGEGGFASLVIGHPDGDATVYELTADDRQVVLSVKRPGREMQVLLRDPPPDAPAPSFREVNLAPGEPGWHGYEDRQNDPALETCRQKCNGFHCTRPRGHEQAGSPEHRAYGLPNLRAVWP